MLPPILVNFIVVGGTIITKERVDDRKAIKVLVKFCAIVKNLQVVFFEEEGMALRLINVWLLILYACTYETF